MPTYVAFLRAINLGARRQFPKDSIRVAVESTGCTGVETYINTGNVRLTTPLRSRAKVERLLEDAFVADRGFEVPTIVFTPAELTDIAAYAASLSSAGRHYVELLRDPPAAELVAELEAASDHLRTVRAHGRSLHLLVAPDVAPGAGAVLSSALAKRLGVSTNRNATVVRELAARWGTLR